MKQRLNIIYCFGTVLSCLHQSNPRSSSVCGPSIHTRCSHFFSLSLDLFAKIPNGLIQPLPSLHLSIVFISRCAASPFPPQYIPIACPRAFCPKGSWDTNTPWGCCFHSLWEKHSREKEREQQRGGSSISLFAWCHYNGNMHKWEKA